MPSEDIHDMSWGCRTSRSGLVTEHKISALFYWNYISYIFRKNWVSSHHFFITFQDYARLSLSLSLSLLISSMLFHFTLGKKPLKCVSTMHVVSYSLCTSLCGGVWSMKVNIFVKWTSGLTQPQNLALRTILTSWVSFWGCVRCKIHLFINFRINFV